MGPELLKCRPDITTEPVDKFLAKMYHTNSDFVFTETRDFVRNCQTPVLIRPDDIPLPLCCRAAELVEKSASTDGRSPAKKPHRQR